MNNLKELEESVATDKGTYVKPTMQVYEMEVETSILTGMESGLSGSEVRTTDTMNPFGGTFNDLKA